MKARVISKTTINNQPAQVGSVVEVDANTFANLRRKGRLEEAVEQVEVTNKKEKK